MTARLSLIGGMLAISSSAFAEGPFIESDLGLVFPVADDQYTSDVNESFKLGVRVGTASKVAGVDFSIDFTPFNDRLTNAIITDVDIQRYRFMLGARYYYPIAPKARLFARFGAGLDLIHYSAKGQFIVNFENSETNAGIALEASAGVLFDLGKVSIGGKIGFPMAFHFKEDDPNDQTDADLKYTSLDVDLAFVINIPF